MHFSTSDLRNLISNPGWRPPPKKPEMASTHAQVSKAVRLWHTQGDAAATSYLTGALSTQTWKKSAGNRTKARVALESFDRYRAWAREDSRTIAVGEPRARVQMAGHTVGAAFDLVAQNADGTYVGRVCQWNVRPPRWTDEDTIVSTGPVVLYLLTQFPPELVAGAEVWQCRYGARIQVDAEEALAEASTIQRLLSGFES